MSIILLLLFLIHWAFVLIAITYIWWGRPQYDKIYLFALLLLIIHWLILGDCIISKIEKTIMHSQSELLEKPFLNPSIQFYQGSSMFTLVISSLLPIMYIINMCYVLNRLKVNIVFIILAAFAFLAYSARFRIQEYQYIKNMKDN
jgi:hypothetical protein